MKVLKKIGKVALLTLMWTVIVLILLVASIYIPYVQDALVPVVLDEVSESTGMKITVDKFRLRFPIDVEVAGALVVEATGDTMIRAEHARVDVSVWPLLDKVIEANDLTARGAYYRMGQPDSTLYLKADVDSFDLDRVAVALGDSKIDLDEALLRGGRVDLNLNPDTVDTPKDTTESTPWIIRAAMLRAHDIDFRMKMMPTIDSLNAKIPSAEISQTFVDLGGQTVDVLSVVVDSLSATYLTPSYAYLRSHPSVNSPPEKEEEESEPWTIRVGKISLHDADALYAVRDAKPAAGFDADHIKVDRLGIEIDSFYNRGTEVVVPLKSLTAHERCGIDLNASGRFAMNDDGLAFNGGDIATTNSRMKVDATLGLNEDKLEKMPFNLSADASIGMADVKMFMPSLTPTINTMPKHSEIKLNADMKGTLADVDVDNLRLSMPNHVELNARGRLSNITNPDKITGRLALDGDIKDVDFLKPTLLDTKMAKQVKLPPTRLNGDVTFANGDIKGDLKAVTGGGTIALDAFYSGRRENYDIDMSLNRFPLKSFMPGMAINNITADIKAKGHGFNPLSKSAKIDATVSVKSADYYDYKFANIDMWANLDSGDFEGGIVSVNQDLDLDLTARGHIGEHDTYDVALNGDIRNLDLKALRLSDTPMRGSLSVDGTAHLSLRDDIYDVNVNVGSIDWQLDDMKLESSRLHANISTTDTTVNARISDDGIDLTFVSKCKFNEFVKRMSESADLAVKQIDERKIDVEALQERLPQFSLKAKAVNGSNILSGPLSLYGVSFAKIDADISNTSRIDIAAEVDSLQFGDMRFDAISINAHQHSKYLIYNVAVDNVPGNLDEFAHIHANGYLADDVLQTFIKQQNRQGETGYNLGFTAEMADSVVTVNFAPLTPIIAYKQWTLNEDNFIKYNLYTTHFDSNFDMRNADSFIRLYTEHDAAHAHDHDGDDGDDYHDHDHDGHSDHDAAAHQEDVILKAGGIKIEEWLSFVPGLPPFSGELAADMRFRWDKKSISGDGNLKIDNLCYDKNLLGSFDNDVRIFTDNSGVVRADADVKVDGTHVISLKGVINDPTLDKPFDLDLSMIRFPLKVVNPFLPKNTAQLSGWLNGDLCIAGDVEKPILNGKLMFDSAAINLPVFGSKLKFSSDEVPIDNSVITFDNYRITTLNENPLTVNGAVNLVKLSNPLIKLNANGNNMQIVGSEESKRALLYGKAFVTLNAAINGDLRLLNVNSQISLLDKTNVTYVFSDFDAAMPTESSDVVTFVSFENPDTTMVDVEVEKPMSMNLRADIRIANTANVTVDLLQGNKLTMQGGGNLSFKMDASDAMSLVGKYTIEKGRLKYKPPLISEVDFEIKRGSSVSFNGDILNPILDVHGSETKTMGIAGEGYGSNRAEFTITANITNTLSNMGIAFDISSTDMTVQSELQALTADQRTNQAMNMLLYGTYTGMQSTINFKGTGSNPLYSFLSGQLNNWASNIKFIDISFGIDEYTNYYGESKQSAVNYSYKVSKSLFDDRAKVVVGGNYSTDTNADENFSQNLISDISVEYALNKNGTMLVRVFRHKGTQSVLEGEITQTGAGFVYRRPMRSLKDIFRFTRRSRPKTVQTNDTTTNVTK